MSDLLKKQATPKTKKVLTLQIEVNVPSYDEEGQLIVDEEEDEEEGLENFEGIFNAHLLEDNQDSYKGSMTDEGSNKSNKSANKQQQLKMNEKER
jgi:hypothetical protein